MFIVSGVACSVDASNTLTIGLITGVFMALVKSGIVVSGGGCGEEIGGEEIGGEESPDGYLA